MVIDKKAISLVEISKLVTSSSNFFEIKDIIIKKMLEEIKPKKACVNLFYKNNFKYAHLVCSSTLEYIPTVFEHEDSEDIKIEFSLYPKYIRDAVYTKNMVWIKNIFEDERTEDERELALNEGYVGRIVIPLEANNNIVGFISCYLEEDDTLSEEDIAYVMSIASLMGLCIEITKKNSDIDILIRKLRGAINFISKATNDLYADKNIDKFLLTICKQICKITASEASLIMLDDVDNKMQRFNQFGIEDVNLHESLNTAMSMNLNQSGKFYNIDEIKELDINKGVNSLIYYCLKRNDKIIGYIASVNSNKYTKDDIKILSVFSNQIYLALEMYLNSRREFDHKLLEKELEIVSIQQRLIMNESKLRFSENKEISYFHKASKHIGGDFCEIIKIDEDNVFIFLADVMGHGILSNYFVAMIKGVIKTLIYDKKSPGQILTILNKILYADFDKLNIFATARAAIFNSKTGKATVANAGHHYPIGISVLNQEVIVKELNFDKGIAIGILENSYYEEHVYNINDYEMIAIYTDGVIEATNNRGEEFGIERLSECIKENHKLDSRDLFNKLKIQIFEFTKNEQLSDDILVVFIKNI